MFFYKWNFDLIYMIKFLNFYNGLILFSTCFILLLFICTYLITPIFTVKSFVTTSLLNFNFTRSTDTIIEEDLKLTIETGKFHQYLFFNIPILVFPIIFSFDLGSGCSRYQTGTVSMKGMGTLLHKLHLYMTVFVRNAANLTQWQTMAPKIWNGNKWSWV
jgi:hypothetical protein